MLKKFITKIIFAVGLSILATTPTYALGRLSGYAEKGGQVVRTAGFWSSTKSQGSYPLATVTVYLAGTTTLATIYSDAALTTKSNPFTAGTDASWGFYAADGDYDIKFSDCSPTCGIAVPWTLSGMRISGGATSSYIYAVDYGVITYGTATTALQQTANTDAIQVAVTTAATLDRPVMLPCGTVLINDTIVSNTGITIRGCGMAETHILQTGAGKDLFWFGPTFVLPRPTHVYNFTISDMHLAGAAGSRDVMAFFATKNVHLSDILITASGRYGIWMNSCEETFASRVHNDGVGPEITGQNETGSSQGVWGSGQDDASAGAAWYLTRATTTINLESCNINTGPGIGIKLAGTGVDAPGTGLWWTGACQGVYRCVDAEDQDGTIRLNTDLWTEAHKHARSIGSTANNGSGLIRVTTKQTAITGATNASPIVITAASHGLKDGNAVRIAGVVGNTAANGDWNVTVVDANSFQLVGSTGNGLYTAGGTADILHLVPTGGRIYINGHNPSTDGWWRVTKISDTVLDLVGSVFVANAGASGAVDYGVNGGFFLKGSKYSTMKFKEADSNGVWFIGANSDNEITGAVNRLYISSSTVRTSVHNLVFGTVETGGWVQDFSPDTNFKDVRSGTQNYVQLGRPGGLQQQSIFPNMNLERWNTTIRPNGLQNYGAATITKESGAGNIVSGSYSAKIVSSATFGAGLSYVFYPVNHVAGKYVTVSGWYKVDGQSFIVCNIDGNPYYHALTQRAGASSWAKFEVTCAVPTSASSFSVEFGLYHVGGPWTAYVDDFNVFIEGGIAETTPLSTSGDTPHVSGPGGGSVPHFYWKMVNAAPTPITQLLSAYAGIPYTIWLSDANSVLTDVSAGGTFNLRGSVSLGGPMMVQLIYDSENATWYQVSAESAY